MNNIFLKYEWHLVTGLAVAAFFLGMYGIHQYFLENGTPHSFMDCIYRSLQMFVLEFAPEENIPWSLEVSRWLAPFTLALTAAKAYFSHAKEQVDVIRAKYYRQHTVICGAGRTGAALCRDLLRQGKRVIVIDHDSKNMHLAPLRSLGALVFVADGNDEELLRKVSLAKAEYLVTLCGDDATNVAIAQAAQRAAKKQFDSGKKISLKCSVRIRDATLKALIYEHPLFAVDFPYYQATIINTLQSAARLLFEEHAPDKYQPVTSLDAPPLHIMIAGFSDFGMELLTQAARVAHYYHLKKLKVTLVDTNVMELHKDFSAQYPALEEVIELTHLKSLPDVTTLTTPVTVAFLCHDKLEQCVSILAELVHLECSAMQLVVVHLDDTPVNSVLAKHPGFTHPGTHSFHFSIQACTAEVICNQKQDALARQYHQGYLAEKARQGVGLAKEESTRPWQLLPEHLKDSNRFLVDHLNVKLRAIGMQKGDEIPSELSADQLEQLAKMEHNRWMAERLLAGWSYAPVKDVSQKRSPSLKGWDELDEKTKDYDRKAVADSFQIFLNK